MNEVKKRDILDVIIDFSQQSNSKDFMYVVWKNDEYDEEDHITNMLNETMWPHVGGDKEIYERLFGPDWKRIKDEIFTFKEK